MAFPGRVLCLLAVAMSNVDAHVTIRITPTPNPDLGENITITCNEDLGGGLNGSIIFMSIEREASYRVWEEVFRFQFSTRFGYIPLWGTAPGNWKEKSTVATTLKSTMARNGTMTLDLFSVRCDDHATIRCGTFRQLSGYDYSPKRYISIAELTRELILSGGIDCSSFESDQKACNQCPQSRDHSARRIYAPWDQELTLTCSGEVRVPTFTNPFVWYKKARGDAQPQHIKVNFTNNNPRKYPSGVCKAQASSILSYYPTRDEEDLQIFCEVFNNWGLLMSKSVLVCTQATSVSISISPAPRRREGQSINIACHDNVNVDLDTRIQSLVIEKQTSPGVWEQVFGYTLSMQSGYMPVWGSATGNWQSRATVGSTLMSKIARNGSISLSLPYVRCDDSAHYRCKTSRNSTGDSFSAVEYISIYGVSSGITISGGTDCSSSSANHPSCEQCPDNNGQRRLYAPLNKELTLTCSLELGLPISGMAFNWYKKVRTDAVSTVSQPLLLDIPKNISTEQRPGVCAVHASSILKYYPTSEDTELQIYCEVSSYWSFPYSENVLVCLQAPLVTINISPSSSFAIGQNVAIICNDTSGGGPVDNILTLGIERETHEGGWEQVLGYELFSPSGYIPMWGSAAGNWQSKSTVQSSFTSNIAMYGTVTLNLLNSQCNDSAAYRCRSLRNTTGDSISTVQYISFADITASPTISGGINCSSFDADETSCSLCLHSHDPNTRRLYAPLYQELTLTCDAELKAPAFGNVFNWYKKVRSDSQPQPILLDISTYIPNTYTSGACTVQGSSVLRYYPTTDDEELQLICEVSNPWSPSVSTNVSVCVQVTSVKIGVVIGSHLYITCNDTVYGGLGNSIHSLSIEKETNPGVWEQVFGYRFSTHSEYVPVWGPAAGYWEYRAVVEKSLTSSMSRTGSLELNLPSASCDDFGFFRCKTVRNSTGEDFSEVASIFNTYRGIPSITISGGTDCSSSDADQITCEQCSHGTGNRRIYARINQELMLTCHAAMGVPAPGNFFNWYKELHTDGLQQSLLMNITTTIPTEYPREDCTIPAYSVLRYYPTHTDQGLQLTCRASNNYGAGLRETVSVCVQVTYVTITITPSAMLTYGQDVTILCEDTTTITGDKGIQKLRLERQTSPGVWEDVFGYEFSSVSGYIPVWGPAGGNWQSKAIVETTLTSNMATRGTLSLKVPNSRSDDSDSYRCRTSRNSTGDVLSTEIYLSVNGTRWKLYGDE